MNLYLTRAGRLRRMDNTLSFETVTLPESAIQLDSDECDVDCDLGELETLPANNRNALPVETIDAIYVFGEVSLNARLLNFLAQKRIPVHFFNYYGHHAGTFFPHAEQLSGDLVIRQGAAYTNPEIRMHIARRILDAALHNIHSAVNYYARRKPGLAEKLAGIESAMAGLDSANNADELMGVEGTVRRLYYGSWSCWLGEAADHFKRSYHPPESPLNALISFINSLLYTACVSELYRTALYPGISYLHAPQSRRFSLALDLTEPFKPVLADRLIFRLWNSRSISDVDFVKHTNGFILTDAARRRILEEWDQQLRATIQVKTLGRVVSYRQLLRLDCYKLINYLLEDRDYRPFRMEY